MNVREFGVLLFDRWTAMWNLELHPKEIMAPEFVLRYAQAGTEAFDDVRHADGLATIVAGWHESHPGLRFFAEGEAVVDLRMAEGAATGLVARPYKATFGEVSKSGVDVLAVSQGLITEVWSVSGARTFYG